MSDNFTEYSQYDNGYECRGSCADCVNTECEWYDDWLDEEQIGAV